MMKRKDPKLELESSRKIFFQLGLFIVGSITLMAFTYKSPIYLSEKKEWSPREIDVPIMLVENEVKPPIDIPKVEKLPTKSEPSTPVFSTDLLNKLKASINRDENQQLVVTTKHLKTVSSGSFKVEPGFAPEGVVIEYPDVDAQFQGSWLGYLKSTMKYPEESILFKESGTAYVSFVVEVDGSVTDVKVKNQGLSENLQKEAIRVIEASPRWKPGSQNGELVRSTKVVKINFILE